MIFNEINHYNKVKKRLTTIIDMLGSSEDCYLNFTSPDFFEDILLLLDRQRILAESLSAEIERLTVPH